MDSIEWLGDAVRLLDQTALPQREVHCTCTTLDELNEAIVTLKVRGAPLLGIAAAYGLLLGTFRHRDASIDDFTSAFESTAAAIGRTRPTAKNLFWALERMRTTLRLNSHEATPTLFEKLHQEAVRIHDEDREMCDAIGAFGADLISAGARVLTHCNTGALATGGIGTAFGVLLTAHRQGKGITVYADETRPLLQGARLTMWELQKHGIPSILITDNTAAWTMRTQGIALAITGADRIAANGDSANKIGTYNVALLAHAHNIPFYIAAPTSTIDPSIANGEQIVIEERGAEEVVEGFGKRTAPNGSRVFAPAFDVTPHGLITGIITEKGILRPPYTDSIAGALQR